MNYLKERNINEFSNDVKKIFNLLTIAGKYRVIGSASLQSIKYFSDYDLDELYKDTEGGILDKIYKSFKRKFERSKEDKNIFITDFKCGLDTNGEPLRWDYNDVMKGYKILDDGRKMTFQECLNIKTTIKLDIIALINGEMTEFSENYYFKFGENEGNYFPYDVNKDNILNQLKHSYDEYMNVDENYMKALKRSYAYKELKDKRKYKNQLIKMIHFFNTDVGFINKIRSELDVILLIIDNTFRKPKIEDIKNNLKIIKDKLNDKGFKSFDDSLMKIINSKGLVIKPIEKIRNELYKFVNKKTLDFILQNKNLLLY